MNCTDSTLAGVRILSFERMADERGWFQRLFCARTFQEHSLPENLPQSSVCWNRQAGTLRGLHWQAAPHPEAKLVTVLHGRVFDVVVDLRPESPTFLAHASFILEAENPTALFIPERCAHGYVTLTDDVLLEYRMTAEYRREAARVVHHADPRLGIEWPCAVACISTGDRDAPPLNVTSLT